MASRQPWRIYGVQFKIRPKNQLLNHTLMGWSKIENLKCLKRYNLCTVIYLKNIHHVFKIIGRGWDKNPQRLYNWLLVQNCQFCSLLFKYKTYLSVLKKTSACTCIYYGSLRCSIIMHYWTSMDTKKIESLPPHKSWIQTN